MIHSSTELLNAPVIHTTVSILIFLHKCTICIIRVLQSFSSTQSNCLLEKVLHYTVAKPQPFDWLHCDKWTQLSVHSSCCIHANFIHTAATKLLVLCQNFPFQIKQMHTYECGYTYQTETLQYSGNNNIKLFTCSYVYILIVIKYCFTGINIWQHSKTVVT